MILIKLICKTLKHLPMFSTAMTYCPIEKNKIRTTLSARQVSLLFIPNAESTISPSLILDV